MKIVLDPGLLWFDKSNEHEEFMYLKDVIDFIDTYLYIQYLPIYEFIMQLNTMAKDPLGEYRESEIVKQDIISKIWKNLDFSNPDDMIYLIDCEKNIIPDDFKIIDREDIKKYLNNLWKLMTEKKYEIVFFLCIAFCRVQRTPMRFRADAVQSTTDALKQCIFSYSRGFITTV